MTFHTDREALHHHLTSPRFPDSSLRTEEQACIDYIRANLPNLKARAVQLRGCYSPDSKPYNHAQTVFEFLRDALDSLDDVEQAREEDEI